MEATRSTATPVRTTTPATTLTMSLTMSLTATTTLARAGATPIDASITGLARLPTAVEKILSFSLHEGSSARHIAAVCESAPELSARILKLANSPTLGCRQPVGQLLQAAVILGVSRIRNLAIAAALVDRLPRQGGPIDPQRFWRHSFAAAAMARWIGQAAGSRFAEDMYLAGLIHDVGICVLVEALPEAYGRIVALAKEKGASLETVEDACLEVNHAEAGYLLASRWPIDSKVLDAVRCHHLPPARPPAAATAAGREIAAALVQAEMACRHHGWGLVLERQEIPEGFALPWAPWGSPPPRAALLDAFGAASLASEELRRLSGV